MTPKEGFVTMVQDPGLGVKHTPLGQPVGGDTRNRGLWVPTKTRSLGKKKNQGFCQIKKGFCDTKKEFCGTLVKKKTLKFPELSPFLPPGTVTVQEGASQRAAMLASAVLHKP